jgi:hypothetical protein
MVEGARGTMAIRIKRFIIVAGVVVLGVIWVGSMESAGIAGAQLGATDGRVVAPSATGPSLLPPMPRVGLRR